ncbi:hypothetical protein [Haladaptatus sp. DYSN1]|nr:hypothetical protein [Haladaptatus sp. DYSN1]
MTMDNDLQSVFSEREKPPRDVVESEPKYWYALAAFLAATLFSIIYIAVVTRIGGQSAISGSFLNLWLIGLVVLAVLSYPALFKDTAFIRKTVVGWNPKSWSAIVFGFTLPLVVFTASLIWYHPSVSVLLGILSFIITTFLTMGFHLYRRHSYIGNP